MSYSSDGNIFDTNITDEADGAWIDKSAAPSPDEETLLKYARFMPGNFIICRVDGDHELLFISDDLRKLLGYVDNDDLYWRTGGKLAALIHRDDVADTIAQITDGTSEGGNAYIHCRVITGDGKTQYVEAAVQRVGSLWCAFVSEIDKKREMHNRDFLTELMNKSYFQECAAERMRLEKGSVSKLAFMWLDIENFKSFNENFGFISGSYLLKNIAGVLSASFPNAAISRFSDDHFVLLTVREDIERHIEAVSDAICEQYETAGLKIRAGVYVPMENDSVAIACDRAKMACDSIRKNYSVKYAFYEHDMGRRVELRQYFVSVLDDAIAHGNIKVYYQPIVRTLTGRICETEALVRWSDQKYGMMPPGEFIDTLEQYRMIHKLDICMMHQIIADYCAQRDRGGIILPSSLNLSRLDFELCDIFQEVDRTMTEKGIPKEMLKIEITESVRGEDSGKLSEGIEKFKRNGYEVWLDDFGSGYSSLSVLKDYNFDTVKFDMRFLRDFERSQKARFILSSNLTMAKRMGLQVLAEGVEREEQFLYLKDIGFDKAQGYLFSKPVPLGNIFELNFEFEDYRDASYYDRVGSIELPDQASMNRGGYIVADVRAVALVELRDGCLHMMSCNDKFREWICSAGIQPDDVETILNSSSGDFSAVRNNFKAVTDKMRGEWLPQEPVVAGSVSSGFYTYVNGNCIFVEVIPVAANMRTGAEAYLVSHTEMTRFPARNAMDKQGKNSEIKECLNGIFGNMLEFSPGTAGS